MARSLRSLALIVVQVGVVAAVVCLAAQNTPGIEVTFTGIAIPPNGAVWYVETDSEQNVLVRFDPQTKKMRTWPIPGGGRLVRHMVAAHNGELWMTESGVGKIGRVRIRTTGPTP